MTPKNIEQIVEEFETKFSQSVAEGIVKNVDPKHIDWLRSALHSYGEYVIGEDRDDLKGWGLDKAYQEGWNAKGAECRKRNV